MKITDKILAIIFYGFVFSIIGITSIYLGSKLLVMVKNDETALIFNTPVATLIAVAFFFLWEAFIKKNDNKIFIKNKNTIIQSAFASLIITILLFIFVVHKELSFPFLKWRILEYLFILIPINTILVLIKISKINKKRSEND